MEILDSARTSAEYAAYDSELSALRMLRNDRAVTDTAMSALNELSARSDGYHRLPTTDALIAAAAPSTAGWPSCTRTATSIASPRSWRLRASRCRSTDGADTREIVHAA
jgi:hypothetical protein